MAFWKVYAMMHGEKNIKLGIIHFYFEVMQVILAAESFNVNLTIHSKKNIMEIWL